MTRVEAKAFSHFDKIAQSAPGTILMAAEPCSVVDLHAGGLINLPVGTSLRVRSNIGGLQGQVALAGGAVKNVSLREEDFHRVDVREQSGA